MTPLKNSINLIVTFLVSSSSPLQFGHSVIADGDSARLTQRRAVASTASPRAALGANQIDEIRTDLLMQAKQSASHLEVIHAILDVEREWRKLKLHREKKQAVQNLISAALTAAAEGRFKSAEFILKDVTASVEADDTAVWNNEVKNQIQQELRNLRALLSRETVRTGLQAVEEYYLSATIRDYQIKGKEKRFLFLGKAKAQNEYTLTEKSLVVRVPELSTGKPLYDREASQEFGIAPGRLTAEDFKSEILGLVQPYQKVKSNSFSLHDSVLDSTLNFWGDVVEPSSGLTYASPFYKDWYRREGRQADSLAVKFQKISYLPLAPQDRVVWQGVINQKANNVKKMLMAGWAQSENGYKFRLHSQQYDQFVSFTKIYENALTQLSAQKENAIMAPDQLNALMVKFPTVSTDRPDTLEIAVEMAIAKAAAANETNVVALINSALVFGGGVANTESLDEIELKALTADDRTNLETRIRTMNGNQLKKALIAMYMSGKESQVRDLFLKLSGEVQRKFTASATRLDTVRNDLLLALDGVKSTDASNLLQQISEAKTIVINGFSSAIEPTLILTQEEIRSLTEQKKITTTYKRIYRAKPEVQFAQQNLRRSLSEAKAKVGQTFALFKLNPGKEVRQALIDFHKFYTTKLKEYKVESWYFKQMGDVHILYRDDAHTQVAYDEHDDGTKIPKYVQDFTVELMPLFTAEQEESLQIAQVYTPEQIEYLYMSAFSSSVIATLNRFSVTIGEEFNQFDEFPSHTIAVTLKGSIENFYSLRKQSIARFIGEPISDDVKDLARLQDLRNVHERNVNAINWITGISGQTRGESDLIAAINQARPRYNDLLQ